MSDEKLVAPEIVAQYKRLIGGFIEKMYGDKMPHEVKRVLDPLCRNDHRSYIIAQRLGDTAMVDLAGLMHNFESTQRELADEKRQVGHLQDMLARLSDD